MTVKKSIMVAAAGILAFSAGIQAQTVVRQQADGDLLVTDYRGKPPHKRQIVSPEDNAYPHYLAQMDTVMVSSTTNNRRGPAGKNIPAQRVVFESVDASEIENMARFEETSKKSDARHWRGAPGKGRPIR